MLKRPESPIHPVLPIETLEGRQFFAGHMPVDLPHLPAFFASADQVQVFGVVLSMTRSFPSSLATRMDIPPTPPTQTSTQPASTERTTQQQLAQTQKAPTSEPTVEQSETTTAAPLERTPADNVVDVQSAAQTVDSAVKPTVPAQSVPVLAVVEESASIPVQVTRQTIQPFSSIPIALAESPTGLDQASRLRELARFNATDTKSTSAEVVESENKLTEQSQSNPLTDSIPLATLPTDAVQLSTFWRNLLAGATLALTTVMGWYLRRTNNRRHAVTASMTMVPRH